jgi:ABC-type oligopeptide transport system substrate-binding subunit
MRIRLLLAAAAAAAAALTLAACSDSSTSPRFSPTSASKDEITCRSGYHIATRDDGTQYCESDTDAINGEAMATTIPTTKPEDDDTQ